MSEDGVALIVLAAGMGSRMNSRLPKPLHPVAGEPMLWRVLRAAAACRPRSATVVLSREIADHPAWRAADLSVSVAIQKSPLGTGDAVRCALPEVGEARWLLVLFADHPLLTPETVIRLIAGAEAQAAKVTVLTCLLDDAGTYGRIERDARGRVVRVVERKEDRPDARQGRVEINSGMMVLDAAWARLALPRIEPSALTGEYYLPELVRLAAADPDPEDRWPVATVVGAEQDLLGVNDRVELARADSILRGRIRTRHMLAGVTLIAPEQIVIDEDVEIGADTTIHPFSVLEAGTRIGSGCEIGPFASLRGARIEDGARVLASTVVEAALGRGADAGPYAHLRAGTKVGPDAHVGNFAEIKNSELGAGSRVGHFSYVGDATVGERANIGAGTVTCNFDGVGKHRTAIGKDAFIGSGTMLVAPVSVGDFGRTGAGSVVIRDVAAGTTVVGVPARPLAARGSRAPSDDTARPDGGGKH